MDDPTNPSAPAWSAPPSAKARNAVQRSVTALLDELAPERVLKRIEHIPGTVEQHRTPNGCVLQAATAAVSVTWFPESSSEVVLGELHVILWDGTVQRRGTPIPRSKKGATLVAELVLRPVDPPSEDAVWQAADGTRYDTASLAAKSISLLEEQIVGHG